jgi:RNA polymerase sigma factor (sigma-70 family)
MKTELLDQDATSHIIIDQCKRGDRKACCRLYEQYAKSMFNICFRMLNNRDDAEDALQEAFVQVFRNIGKYRGEATIGSWIKRIVVNHCINIIRKRKVYWESADELDIPDMQEVDEQEFAGTVARVKDAVNRLPDGYRVVLSMYIFEDYSHREIAQMLNITESTAKTQYMRAKEKVRQLLQGSEA